MQWPGIVVYTRRWQDWFRKRLWVRCWHCDLKRGPFVTREEANRELGHECPSFYPDGGYRPEDI